MNNIEFSAEFDVLYNNITSNQAPGLNEYEKSVFLTKAQAQLINEYFNNRTDGVGGGFDGSQKRQYDFSSLIKTVTLATTEVANYSKIDKRSKCFVFPADYFLAVNEAIADPDYQYSIIPLSYAEYTRVMMKPYAYPVKKAAWRLITGKKSGYEYNKNGYNVHAFSTGELSITYVRLPDYDTNEEDRWYTPADSDALQGVSVISHGMQEETIPYLNLDTGEGTAAMPYNQGKLGVVYQDKPYWIQIRSNQTKTSYYIYLYDLANTNPLTDDVVFTILHKFFYILKLNSSSPLHSTIYNELTPFYERFGDLSGAVIPSSRNFERSWSTMTGYPGDATAYDDITGDPTDYVPDYKAYTFSFTGITNLTIVEIIGKFRGSLEYTLRYIKKPNPIILTSLEDEGFTELSIDGIKEESSCELPEETHQEILERAVALAKIAWAGGTATQAAQQNKE